MTTTEHAPTCWRRVTEIATFRAQLGGPQIG